MLRSKTFAIFVAVAITTVLDAKFFEKKLNNLRSEKNRELHNQHSKSFNAGWSSAMGMYNRHPHLYCEDCQPKAE